MQLLHLPPELLVEILRASASIRSLQRALRLRLVCKSFDALFEKALFATDLLEADPEPLRVPPAWQDNGLGFGPFHGVVGHEAPAHLALRQRFLYARLQKPNQSLSNVLMMIKPIAENYCREAGLADKPEVFRECVWRLCDFRFRSCVDLYFFNPGPMSPEKCKQWTADPRSLLVAAICMDDMAVVRKAIEYSAGDYFAPFGPSNGLECPALVAARLRRHEMLDLMIQDGRLRMAPYDVWEGCALGGDHATAETIFRHWPLPVSKTEEGLFSSNYDERDLSQPRKHLWMTRDTRTYADISWLYLGDWDDGPFNGTAETGPQFHMHRVLCYCAAEGLADRVEQMIALGALVNTPFRQEREQPISEAASCFQTDMVRQLLGHGADPNGGHALKRAAQAGSLEIVRLLLEHGADVNLGDPKPVDVAASLEHEAMVELLEKYGGVLGTGLPAGAVVAHGGPVGGSWNSWWLDLPRV